MKIYSFVATALLLTAPVLPAQPRNGGEGGPDRVGRLSRVITDCEQRTNDFRGALRVALDHSRLNNTAREDELNRQAGRLERSMNRVRESWNLEHNPGRTRRAVSEAISAGQDINRTMVRRRLNPDVERQWEIVRSELNRLAEAFELPRVRW